MTDSSELMNPFSEDKPQLAGSVFINNTSYSGCDIKILITMYDNGTGMEQLKTDLEEQIAKDEKSLETCESELSKQKSTLTGAKKYSSEWFLANRKKNSLSTKYSNYMKRIISNQERLQGLQKSKVSTKVLAECQTLSLSVFRDKQAVRSCGTVYPKGFTRGPREIAGSLIFTVFNEHVLYQFLEAHASDFDAVNFSSAVLDQLPPVDINISFANEYGAVSRMAILGVEFLTEGQNMSIEDLLSENVVNFVARDFDPMRSVSQRKMDENSIMTIQYQGKRASDLILEEDYQAIKNAISPFERFHRRRNPFL